MRSGRNGWMTDAVPFSGWFEYPAAFGALAVSQALRAADLSPGGLVLDPFAGIGTTISAVAARGVRGVGLESAPLVARLAALKFTSRRDTTGLRTAAAWVAAGLEPLPVDQEHELVRRCFDPTVLGLLVAARERIAGARTPWREHLELALLAGLRDHACVEVGWSYPRPGRPRVPRSVDPGEALIAHAGMMADELDSFSPAWAALGRVVLRDARSPFAWRELSRPGQADAIVTSPPYFNNYDYVDAGRLELLFAAAPADRPGLLRRARAAMVASSVQQASGRKAVEANRQLAQWPRTAATARVLGGALRRRRLARGRGKAYDVLLPIYLRDMGMALARTAEAVRPGATLVMVVGDSAPSGVRVDTPAILAALAAEQGFDFEGDEVLRARGGRFPAGEARHGLPLEERVVRLRRHGRRRPAARAASGRPTSRALPAPRDRPGRRSAAR